MKVTDFTRRALAVRRRGRALQAEKSSLPQDGWELVDDRGGQLWTLNRGVRKGQSIQAVRIAADGQSLWVKIGEQA
jgi:hypothetical protein